jgi:hypothetical protein
MHVIRLLNSNEGKSGSLAKAAYIRERWEVMMKVTCIIASTASFGISLLYLLDSFDVGRLAPVQCSIVHMLT